LVKQDGIDWRNAMANKGNHYKNRVELAGRVSGEPSEKTLPSGDVVAEFRLVIDRDDREGVDTLDVAVWKAQLRKRALSLEAEEWIGIKGVLRRRFWKAGTGIASRWQVEAREIERI
jgi:single-strand DNA-binding protein